MTFFVRLRGAYELQTIVPAFWDLQHLLHLQYIYVLRIWNECNFFPEVLFYILQYYREYSRVQSDTKLKKSRNDEEPSTMPFAASLLESPLAASRCHTNSG